MGMDMNTAIVRELHLLLIYLTSWEDEDENQSGSQILRAWKGYLFEILDDLEAQQYITQSRASNMLVLTEEGKQEALLLKRKYLQARE